jgi:MFS family permease
MKRAIRWYDYITINVYFLGLTTVAQTNGLVFPLLVQVFVGMALQGTYLGRLRLWTLMLALLMQALMGMFSDRSTLRWGRRRPFIFVGTLLTLGLIIAVGYSTGMQGMDGFWFLFGIALLMQATSNTAQAAQQGLIPDLVPSNLRGRFSGVKTLFELPLPLIIVSLVIGRIISAGNLLLGLLIAAAVLLLSMLLTMLVPEKPLEEAPPPIDWQPFIRLLIMTGAFTAVILGSGYVVGIVTRLLEGVTDSTLILILMGFIGVAAMTVAVVLGVWLSVRISLGESARQNPSFTWWVVNRLAFLVGANNLSYFAIYFLQARLGYEREAAAAPAALLMLFVGISILVSAIPSGWLADRFGAKRMVALSGFIAAFGVLVVLLTTNLTIIYIGGCIIGIAIGFFFTTNWALGTVLVPKKEAGRYLGLSNLAGAGAGAVGAYIGGPIADYVSASITTMVGAGYVLLFTLYGLLFLLSTIPLLGIRQQVKNRVSSRV